MSDELLRQAAEALTHAKASLAPYAVRTEKIDAAIAGLQTHGEEIAQIRGAWHAAIALCSKRHEEIVRLRAELHEIARTDPVDAALDSLRAVRIAREALRAPKPYPAIIASDLTRASTQSVLTDQQIIHIARQNTVLNGSHEFCNYVDFARAVLAQSSSSSPHPAERSADHLEG